MEGNITQIEKPQSGGELTIPIIQFDTLNPILNENKSVYYFDQLIYEGLIGLDENLEVHPALAKNWTSMESGKVWVFELREGVTWHDGKSFSGEDVKFTIDAIKTNIGKQEASIYGPYVQHIKNVKIMDPLRISITFDSPLENPIEIFNFPIIPKHRFSSIKDVYKAKKITPIGTGPYKVESYDKFKNVQLITNENYWGKAPYITKIHGLMVPDKEAALTSLEANEVSVAEADNLDWEKYSENKSLKIYEYITQEYEFLGFNFNRKLTKDIRIRKAIAYSIDRHKIIKEIYLGHGTVADGPIYPGSTLYDEEEKSFGKDVVKAKELLLQSNWENRDADPWLEDEFGEELRFTLIVNKDNDKRVEVANRIASELEEIGVKVTIDLLSWEGYEKRIFSNQFDLALGGWLLSNPWDLRFAFHSNYLGSTNFIGYSNPEMDNLLDEGLVVKEYQVRKETYKQLQHVFVQDLPYFSLYFINNSLIVNNSVKGKITPTPLEIYSDIREWYIQGDSK